MRGTSRVALLCLSLLSGGLSSCDDESVAAQEGSAQEASARERVHLRATHPDGVPLHPAEHASTMSGRLPGGVEVQVLRWGEGRRWLEVQTSGGTRGWISRRYVDRSPPPLPPAWASPAACEAAPRPQRRDRAPRIASWNLRWFPDGSTGGPGEHATDVPWMACAIASLDVDAIAVQEVMRHARGRRAMDALTAALSERTGGRWRGVFDGCPSDGRQHVGLLYDATRVDVASSSQLDDVNPLGGCAGHLRPGLRVSASVGARPLELVVVHLDSGVEARDRTHRRQSAAQLAEFARARAGVLVLGDFNTMGAGDERAEEERSSLDAQLARGGLRRPEGEVGCTEFYRGHGASLDHVYLSSRLRIGARLEGAGVCDALSCALPRGQHPEALRSLSDHCPIVVQLGR